MQFPKLIPFIKNIRNWSHSLILYWNVKDNVVFTWNNLHIHFYLD
jgi:hypothetical protein